MNDVAQAAPRPESGSSFLDAVAWDPNGLVAAVAQEQGSARVLMVAWMNRDALAETVRSGFATYWSRSRQRLWRKGEESGHRQQVHAIELDCDGDALVLRVSQAGGIACHTGRHSCFFRTLKDGQWMESEHILKDPREIYGSHPLP